MAEVGEKKRLSRSGPQGARHLPHIGPRQVHVRQNAAFPERCSMESSVSIGWRDSLRAREFTDD